MRKPTRLPRFAASLLSTAILLIVLGEPAPAQLASGSWPMFHSDLRHTGQSPLLGPLFPSGTPAATDVEIWHGFDKIRTSPSLSADGSVLYVGLGFYFCAIDAATMKTNWCYHLHADVSDSSPAVDKDGIVYVGDRDNTLSAFYPNGTVKWQYNNGYEGDIWTAPAIAPAGLPSAGTIYFAHDQSFDGLGVVTAMNPDGTVKWKYVVGTRIRNSSPAIDQSGIIYFGDLAGVLHAFQDNGACPPAMLTCGNAVKLWSKQVGGSTPGLGAAPVISADSTILYIGSSTGLTALDISNNPAPPTVLWTFATTGNVDRTPALATDGTLYVPAMLGSQKRVYALDSDGTQKWVFGPMNTGAETSAYPIVGADGVVYVGLNKSVYALSPAGNVLWTYPTTNFMISFPLIGGTADPATGGLAVLYLPSQDHNIYKISGMRTALGTNHPPVADAGGPYGPVMVGQTMAFDGSGSDDPDPDDVITLSWDFGDGSVGSGANPSHGYLSPSPPGGYPVTLTVSDGLATATDTVYVEVSGSPISSFTDDFNRADFLGGPDPQWAVVAGHLAISGGQLANTLQGYNMAFLPDLTSVEQSAEADFTSGSNNAAPRLGVVLRFQDANNHYRVYRSVGGSSQVRIAKVVSGVETIRASAPIAQPVVNTPFHLKGTAVGSTLTLWLDGAQKLTVTDATHAGGSLGLFIYTGPTAIHAADNFCASLGASTCP
jgi:hypothetical protein